MEEQRKKQIQRQGVFFTMLVVVYLGTGGFAVSRGISAYQSNVKIVQLYNEIDIAKRIRLHYKEKALKNKAAIFAEITSASQAGFGTLAKKLASDGIKLEPYVLKNELDIEESEKILRQNRNNLNLEFILLGVSLGIFLLLPLIMRSFQQVNLITFSDYLTCYFPEEIVAELTALRARLTDDKKSTWLIRFILFYQIITLVWGIYIQIKIDNLISLARDRKIDK
jgi:hypothetical protein